MKNKIYRVYDNAGEKLVGYFDTTENILIGIYHHLKHMKVIDDDPVDWMDYAGGINDFIIYEVELNAPLKTEEKDTRVYIIDDSDYKKFMLYGPREINIDKILND